jgi:hypothetical protein
MAQAEASQSGWRWAFAIVRIVYAHRPIFPERLKR